MRSFSAGRIGSLLMDNSQWALPQGATSGQGPGAGVVSRYRFAPRPGGICRLVLDLDAPASLVRQELGATQLRFDLASSVQAVASVSPAPLRLDGAAFRRKIIV